MGGMMNTFNLSIPTKIFFGEGILDEAFKQNKDILKGILMIITGKRAMRRLGYIELIEAALKKYNDITEIIVFEGISPNPKVSEINDAIRIGLENNANVVLGLGGGSAIDAAKAAAVGIGAKENINEYVLNGKTPSKKTLPIIAIPSTAGTGSELSKGAVISFPERNIKTGIRGENIYPKVAIVDPRFTYELPKRITCETGFDVFTHATETYISKKSNAFTEMLSIEVLNILSEYLPLLTKDLNNKKAREKMSYSSMLMGINLGNASTCLPHRLQYPIGAKTDTSHSTGLASIYKSWIYHSYEYSVGKFNRIGTILSGKKCSDKVEVMNSITKFMESIDIDINLIELGIKQHELPELIDNVSGNIENDPASFDENIIEKIYLTAYNNIFE